MSSAGLTSLGRKPSHPCKLLFCVDACLHTITGMDTVTGGGSKLPLEMEKELDGTPKQSETETGEKLEANASQTPDSGKQTDVQPITSSTCKPISLDRPKIDLPSQRINAKIQYMRDHALIGKFIGFLPTEKALQGWISSKWKPKGHVTLQLGLKFFSIAIFNYIEDRNKVIDGGPYFFNLAGLRLRN